METCLQALTIESYPEASALWAHLSAANFIVGSYEGERHKLIQIIKQTTMLL